MTRANRLLRCVTPVVVLAMAFQTVATFAGDGKMASLTRSDRWELWQRNKQLIEQAESAPLPQKLAPLASDAKTAERVDHWLSVYHKLYAKQKEAKQREYERYVERAKGHLKDKELREALIETTRATLYASDKDALLNSDWVRELEGLAAAKAKELQAEKDWNKAFAFYSDLAGLFEDNKEYEKRRGECLNIARLDAIYEDESRWTEMLEGIDPRNATDAMIRIERFYVEQADFRGITQSGFEHLLLLGESEKMREVFDGLGDVELRGHFNDRLTALLGRVKRSGTAGFRSRKANEFFRRAMEINEETVQLPEELMVYEYMLGALDPLDDFTSVIWPIEFREFDKHTRGDFVGVGISISGGDKFPVTVVTPLEDTPAYRAGILPDDVITHVNGKTIEGLSLNKVVRTITGPINTDVTLTIDRHGSDPFDVTLKRARVQIFSVKGFDRDSAEEWNFMIDTEIGIGYARVNSFQENTVDQLRSAIEDMLDQNAKGLILDLRFNPGGLMKAAIDMAQLFLSRDEIVVSTRGMHDPQWRNPDAATDGPFRDLPLIVLVNDYSASASEIVSGALQDHKRALIVGERTFGKFSVQKLMQLGGGIAHLKLTTARYYLPSGREMHHDEGRTEWGVMPNVEHRVVPKEIYRIREMWRARELLGKSAESDDDADEDADGDKLDDENLTSTDGKDAKADDANSESKDDDSDDEEDDEEEEDKLNLAEDPNEFPEIDLQLDTALLLLRLHLIGERDLVVAAAEQNRDSENAPKVRNR